MSASPTFLPRQPRERFRLAAIDRLGSYTEAAR